MNVFRVKLPFIYTIEFCVWFDDHVEAEARYHRLFAAKHLNGEWFSLDPADLDLVRCRRLS